MRILKSLEAENDLDKIWLDIAKDNPYYADKLLDEIEETNQKLARPLCPSNIPSYISLLAAENLLQNISGAGCRVSSYLLLFFRKHLEKPVKRVVGHIRIKVK